MVLLNCCPREQESFITEGYHFTEGFGASRGWPFCAWSRGNEYGRMQWENSVTRRGYNIIQNTFSGEYPHLTYLSHRVTHNAVCAILLTAGACLITRKFCLTA